MVFSDRNFQDVTEVILIALGLVGQAFWQAPQPLHLFESTTGMRAYSVSEKM